ncbi:hypothetical protein RSOLAG1IB_12001 [Rhizoctonia solani AG-1 IB]|uniref:Transmembrane protein n=1 Tax=Thanatephorus cucumeris (strain AG1-IB / isolate 7/3/14) TaxID=1108050 RepID=A0A0B7FKH8_THACB|nr:hypothetical protein RSOLAG1IB_12001 [Rhizoctonia solani AG-1 IB]
MLDTHNSGRGTGARILSILGIILWGALYVITLGFSHKYRQRLRSFECLDPYFAIEESTFKSCPIRKHYKEYSQPPSYLGIPYRLVGYQEASENDSTSTPIFERVNFEYDGSLRGRQREEWDKLSTAASVITATSAAALAIPDLAGPGSYWMVNTCFCAALGVSLEGLILVFYITIMASGTSDETIGRLARGRVEFLRNFRISARLPALIMALPVVFATYSSLFLLIGCSVMVMMGPIHTQNAGPNPYYYLPMVPIGFGFICAFTAVLVCEVTTYREEQLRLEHKSRWTLVKKSIKEQVPPFERRTISAETVIAIWRTSTHRRQEGGESKATKNLSVAIN